MPRADAVRVLELDPEDFVAPVSDPARFGDLDRDLTWMGYRHVIVEVPQSEADQRWPAGFYKGSSTLQMDFGVARCPGCTAGWSPS